MQTATIEATKGDFKDLATQIRAAGLLDRRPVYYGVKISLTIAAFAAAWAALVLVGNSWLALAVAGFLGFAYTQLGFIGHDVGHQQVFRSRRANRLLGLGVGNALIGVSFGWWVPKHSAHHAHPNEVGVDPDLDAALVPREERANPAPRPGGLMGLLEAWQAWLFFPFMLLRSIGLHYYGIGRLLQNRDRAAAIEGSLIALNLSLYLLIVFWVLSPLKALAFIAIQQAVFSVYLGCSFAPNHKGMALIEPGEEVSFATRQVTTSRNVASGRLTNFLLGGLNFQIEHHLFPSMPRPNLARAQAIVRNFCVDSGLGYREDSFVGSFRVILRQLHAVAAAG